MASVKSFQVYVRKIQNGFIITKQRNQYSSNKTEVYAKDRKSVGEALQRLV